MSSREGLYWTYQVRLRLLPSFPDTGTEIRYKYKEEGVDTCDTCDTGNTGNTGITNSGSSSSSSSSKETSKPIKRFGGRALRTCQIVERHWIVKQRDGSEERVDGPGLVGKFPLLTQEGDIGDVEELALYSSEIADRVNQNRNQMKMKNEPLKTLNTFKALKGQESDRTLGYKWPIYDPERFGIMKKPFFSYQSMAKFAAFPGTFSGRFEYRAPRGAVSGLRGPVQFKGNNDNNNNNNNNNNNSNNNGKGQEKEERFVFSKRTLLPTEGQYLQDDESFDSAAPDQTFNVPRYIF